MRKFIVSFISSDLAFHRVNILFSEVEQVTFDTIQEKTKQKVKNSCDRIVDFRIIAWSSVDEFSS